MRNRQPRCVRWGSLPGSGSARRSRCCTPGGTRAADAGRDVSDPFRSTVPSSSSAVTTCRPGLRGSIKRRMESALPNTTLQCGAGMVVTAVIGFFPSTASYERICLPEGRFETKASEAFLGFNGRLNCQLVDLCLCTGPRGVRCRRS